MINSFHSFFDKIFYSIRIYVITLNVGLLLYCYVYM